MVTIIREEYIEDVLDEVNVNYDLKYNDHFKDCVEDLMNDEGHIYECDIEDYVDQVAYDFLWSYNVHTYDDNTIDVAFFDAYGDEIATYDALKEEDLEHLSRMNETEFDELCSEIYDEIKDKMGDHYYDDDMFEDLEYEIKAAIHAVWTNTRHRSLMVMKEVEVEELFDKIHNVWRVSYPERAKKIVDKVYDTFNAKLVHKQEEIEDFIRREIINNDIEMNLKGEKDV